MAVVYFNTSFWWWVIWLFISYVACGFRTSGPFTYENYQNMLIAAIVICLIC